MEFRVNLEKCALTPMQKLPWLGTEWETINVTLSLSLSLWHPEGVLFQFIISTAVGGSAGLPQLYMPGPPARAADAGGQVHHSPVTTLLAQASAPHSTSPAPPLVLTRHLTPISTVVPTSHSAVKGDGSLRHWVGLPMKLGAPGMWGVVGGKVVTGQQPPGADGGERMPGMHPPDLRHECLV